jgi:hypothetical protein
LSDQELELCRLYDNYSARIHALGPAEWAQLRQLEGLQAADCSEFSGGNKGCVLFAPILSTKFSAVRFSHISILPCTVCMCLKALINMVAVSVRQCIA